MVLIMWLLELQLPIQSVPITTNDVSSNPAHGDAYSIQLCYTGYYVFNSDVDSLAKYM